MSIIKHVTLQKIVAHDFPYDPRKNSTHTQKKTERTWKDFWMCDAERGQRVAQLHDSHMIMMIIAMYGRQYVTK